MVYGNEMIYVSLNDGSRVGRLNLKTGKVVMEKPELCHDFDCAVEDWKASHFAVPGDVTAANLHDPALVVARSLVNEVAPVALGARDLAMNRPGEAARARAIELKRAAPVRTLIARALGNHTNERAWRVGADGEVRLPNNYGTSGIAGRHPRRTRRQRGADIDHLVIGPGGVFTLNTKNHRDKNVWVAERSFMVNGYKTDYLQNFRFEASRASKLLSAACGFQVAVAPVIVIMAAKLTIKAQPVGVCVVGRRRIVGWLSRRPILLAPDEVDQIYARAQIDATWHADSGQLLGQQIPANLNSTDEPWEHHCR